MVKCKIGHEPMDDTAIIYCAFFVYRAQLCGDSPGVPYSEQTLSMLSQKVVWRQHFSEAGFTLADCVCLNRIVVPNFCVST
jgi:hypothetical protein